jgi:hypothetical protein
VSPDHPPRDYDTLAASLLAQIADALLNGRRDWAVLEGLQAALLAPKGTERLREVSDAIAKSDADAVTKSYVDRIQPFSVSREALGHITYGYTDTFTTNPSQHYWNRRKT